MNQFKMQPHLLRLSFLVMLGASGQSFNYVNLRVTLQTSSYENIFAEALTEVPNYTRETGINEPLNKRFSSKSNTKISS